MLKLGPGTLDLRPGIRTSEERRQESSRGLLAGGVL